MLHPHFAGVLSLPMILGAWAMACLPTDTRPPPATVLVTVSGGALTKNGIPAAATSDGWEIGIDRFLVVLGDASLDGDACVAYSDARYARIFDGRTADRQKLSVLYGLSGCDFGFRADNPDQDSIINPGVTEDDKTMMRTPGSNKYAGDQPTGISIFIKGKAQKLGVTKTFAWPFRTRRLSYRDCSTAGVPFKLQLENGSSVSVDIQLHGEALFQDKLDPTKAKLRFAPFAKADDDGDHDGEVTLDELGKVTLDAAGITPADLDRGVDAGVPPPPDDAGGTTITAFKTFEDFVYLGLFPQTVRLSDRGICTAVQRVRRD